MKLGMISLGCAKNLIDSELFLGVAKKYDLEITNNLKEANIIVVNTCGFIESAKKEAIDTILEVTENKKDKIVIAMGCLVERYLDDLKKSLPEVDIYFPIKDYKNIDELFQKLLGSTKTYKMNYEDRLITTLPHSAYLRISEGCNNRCSYCAIPLIRGPFTSRPFESLISEAKYLAKCGVKEITLIGQDTTRYGTDLKEGKYLQDLLHEISNIPGVSLVRVLYLYPDEITDEVINEIKNNPKVAKYFDIPIQHASNKILKAMNRRGSKEFIVDLIAKIRKQIPDVTIRTTLIVGFPTENNQDFKELVDFVEEIKFNRLGVFTYSDEEDTKGYLMKPKVSETTMKKRLNAIMQIQNGISNKLNHEYIGKTYSAIIDSYDSQANKYIVRNEAYAPDDVDGFIYATNDSGLKVNIGDIVKIKITDANSYDLFAKIIKFVRLLTFLQLVYIEKNKL